MTSPFSVVRGERYEQKGGLLDSGYYLSGATVQGAMGRRIYLAENLFIAFEGKLTASYARVNIAMGMLKCQTRQSISSSVWGMIFNRLCLM